MIGMLVACGDDIKPIGPTPLLSSKAPADGATGVARDTVVTATFNTEMAPLDATAFTLHQGATNVSGTVTLGTNGKTATFTPSNALAPNSDFTATIGTAATSALGMGIVAESSWTFTTEPAAFADQPEVTDTNPNNAATGVTTNASINATFSEAMDPASVTATSFTLLAGITPVPGSVNYSSGIATFTPTTSLAINTSFTARLTTEWKNSQGTPLAAAVTWTFMTGATASLGPAPVLLGTAGNFVVLAKAAISTVPQSVITGNVGVSPAAASYLTGFSLVADATNVFSTSTQVVGGGKAYGANYAVPTPSNLTTAVSNMQTAYTDAAGRPLPDFSEFHTGNIGSLVLVPGLYKWTTDVTIPNDVTIAGGANDVWIFETTGNLLASANKRVILAGGARAKNIFWQVAGQATFGAGSHFEGILLCKTAVTLQTGATMNGRILAQTMVALQAATVTKP